MGLVVNFQYLFCGELGVVLRGGRPLVAVRLLDGEQIRLFPTCEFRLMTKASESYASIETKRSPSRRTLRGLDWLNFLLADVQTGVGPFLAIYLAGYQWNEERVGLALTVGGIAGILTQTPAGGLVDFLRSKRALVGVAVAAMAAGALLIAFPRSGPSWAHRP